MEKHSSIRVKVPVQMHSIGSYRFPRAVVTDNQGQRPVKLDDILIVWRKATYPLYQKLQTMSISDHIH